MGIEPDSVDLSAQSSTTSPIESFLTWLSGFPASVLAIKNMAYQRFTYLRAYWNDERERYSEFFTPAKQSPYFDLDWPESSQGDAAGSRPIFLV